MSLRADGFSVAPPGHGEPLPVDPALLRPVVGWIGAIPFERWPQQNRLPDGLLRPAMVGDPAWESFGKATDELVRAVSERFFGGSVRERNRLLSVVMPGAFIDPHEDELGSDWLVRVHVPLITNSDAMFITGDVVRRMPTGFAYAVDTRERHAVWNAGRWPRVHLMFDLHQPKVTT